MRKEAKILISITILAIVGAIALFASQPESAVVSAPVDGNILLREGSHMTGTASAKVQVVEFGDYQCPACGAVNPTVVRLIEEYKDNPEVNFVFRNFPLPGHRNARISAQAAEAAAEQGKFWEMHDMLYTKQGEWSDSSKPIDIFTQYATELGLNVEQFKDAVTSGKFTAVISADFKDGDELGVNSTPTFFINGVKFGNGISSYDDFKTKIESELSTKTP